MWRKLRLYFRVLLFLYFGKPADPKKLVGFFRRKNEKRRDNMKLEIEYIPIDKITPDEKNAKEHPQEQIEQIKKSIEDNGMNDPIAIWGKKNIIVEGHGRLMALKELGHTEVPVIRLDHLTDNQRKAYALIHNKTTMNSGFNEDILNEILQELAEVGIDMDVFGFEGFDIEEDDTEAQEDFYEPELPEQPKAKRGDIYQLGSHRLMCGDSTDEADVEKLLDGEEMDLCLTDPPYNVNYGEKVESLSKVSKEKGHDVFSYSNGSRESSTIENDNMDDESFYNFLFNFYTQMMNSLKPGGVFYICHADSEGYNFRKALKDAGGRMRQTLIWVKPHFVMGRQDYHWRHEPILYGWKEGAGHYYIDDRTQNTVWEDKPDIDNMKKEEMKQLLKEIYEEDRISTSAIHEAKPTVSELHPTMKPIKLMGRFIKNSAKPGEKVIDFFGGSGSTLIACEQLNRTCYTMEYDPKYVDVIIDRWEALTGQKAVKING